jgi:hypothetical protein
VVDAIALIVQYTGRITTFLRALLLTGLRPSPTSCTQRTWTEPSLVDLGVPLERSYNLAIVVVAALEGAIILARIRRDLSPFEALVLELRPLLDAVARHAAPEK